MYKVLRRRLMAWWRYALVGAVTCLMAGIVSEVLIQALQLETQIGNPHDPLVIVLLVDASSHEDSAEIAEARRKAEDTWSHVNYNLDTFYYSSSNLGDDLLVALQEANKIFIDRASTRNAVFLFSNNAPVSGLEQILRLVSSFRQNGVFFVTVGTEDSNQELLRVLSTKGTKTFFSAERGKFVRAFQLAARSVNASSVGTGVVTRGTVVNVAAILLLIGGIQVADNKWGLRGHWWRDLWWVTLLGMVFGIGLGSMGKDLVQYWALVGIAIGAVLGIPNIVGSPAWPAVVGASRKTLLGALFGLFGGVAGASLVRLILMQVDQIPIEDVWKIPAFRTTGLVVLGIAVAFFYKLGEDWLKNAWLLGTAEGDNKAKIQVLDKPKVKIGHSKKNDICLYRSKQIADYAGSFIQHGEKWLFQPEKDQAERLVTINGRTVRNLTILPDRSLMRIGDTALVFRQRRMSGLLNLKTRWILVGDKQEYLVPLRRRITLGGEPTCGIVMSGLGVESRHCTLAFAFNGLRVESFEGLPVFVNDKELKGNQYMTLQQGDLLTIGRTDLALVLRSRSLIKGNALPRLLKILRPNV